MLKNECCIFFGCYVIKVFSWSPVFFLTSFICIFANKKCVTVLRMLPGLESETSTLIKLHRRTLFRIKHFLEFFLRNLFYSALNYKNHCVYYALMLPLYILQRTNYTVFCDQIGNKSFVLLNGSILGKCRENPC